MNEYIQPIDSGRHYGYETEYRRPELFSKDKAAQNSYGVQIR